MERSFLEVKNISQKLDYDGSQLSPHWIYKNIGIMGDAAVSFIGACNIPNEQIADIEDILDQQEIRADKMLHFIVEVFGKDCLFGALVQCVFISEIQSELLLNKINVERKGDDLFIDQGKLSISIATASCVSTLIHIGLNINNEGTPVKTACLSDYGIEPVDFSMKILQRFNKEFSRIILASSKVKARI
jgi:uncharacterized protein